MRLNILSSQSIRGELRPNGELQSKYAWEAGVGHLQQARSNRYETAAMSPIRPPRKKASHCVQLDPVFGGQAQHAISISNQTQAWVIYMIGVVLSTDMGWV